MQGTLASAPDIQATISAAGMAASINTSSQMLPDSGSKLITQSAGNASATASTAPVGKHQPQREPILPKIVKSAAAKKTSTAYDALRDKGYVKSASEFSKKDIVISISPIT